MTLRGIQGMSKLIYMCTLLYVQVRKRRVMSVEDAPSESYQSNFPVSARRNDAIYRNKSRVLIMSR